MALADGPSGVARVSPAARPCVPDARSGGSGRARRALRRRLGGVRAARAGRRDPPCGDPARARAARVHAAEIARPRRSRGGRGRLRAPRSRAAPAARARRIARSCAPRGRSTCRWSCTEVLRTLAHEAAPRWAPTWPASISATRAEGGVATAGYNVPDEWHGRTISPGEGAAGTVLLTGETFATNDYQRDVTLAARDGELPHGGRGPDGVERRAQGRAVGRLDLDAADRRGRPAHARGDRRPRDGRLPQRRDLPPGPAGRPHRRADRAAQPRRHAGPRARGDRPRAPRRHAAELRDHRPRRLQARQRRPRPPGRRRAAAPGRRRAAGRAAARTTRSPATAATSSCSCCPGSDEARRHGRGRARARRRASASWSARARSASPQWHEPLDADGLLEHADRALLLAKRTGKGRVAVANADVERELAMLQAAARLARRRAGARRRDRGARQLHARALRGGRPSRPRRGDDPRARDRAGRADRPRGAAARRRQARGAGRDPAQARAR